jgi:magnesium chelatase family protein
VIPADAMVDRVVLCEISLKGVTQPVSGALSAVIFELVMAARKLTTTRSCQDDGTLNAKLTGDYLDMAISKEDDAKILLNVVLEQQQLSAYAYHKIMRVVQTIADLNNKPVVTRRHLAKSLAYRAMPLFA